MRKTSPKYLYVIVFALSSIGIATSVLAGDDRKEREIIIVNQPEPGSRKHSDTKVHKTSISIVRTTNKNRLILNQNGVEETFVLPLDWDKSPATFKSASGQKIVVSHRKSNTLVKIANKEFTILNNRAKLSTRIHKQLPIQHHPQQSVYISGHKLNENQKEIIRKAFESIGIKRKILFDDRQITIIKTEKIEFLDNEKTQDRIKKIFIDLD